MTSAAITVSGLGKEYALGQFSLWRALRGCAPGERVQALDDVSFEVGRGEVLGIIGGNGAGKSTLLKILARITGPSTGRAEIRGRVSSLLEVGTGFHPELSGRENVFLSGALLGMRRQEIRRRFDEIAAFSEIENFLDTPVKHYSSGMYVRLAFAVAAHLEADLLLVDEVLAVGDAAFQKKCLGRMQGAAASGRTVLLVSHNMASIARLAQRCLVLERGRLVHDGDTGAAIEHYLGHQAGSMSRDLRDAQRPAWLGEPRGLRLEHVSVRCLPAEGAGGTGTLEMALDYSCTRDVGEADFGIGICDRAGNRLATLRSDDADLLHRPLPGRQGTALVRLDARTLPPGQYLLQVSASSAGTVVDSVQEALLFDMPASGTDMVALQRRNHSLGVRLLAQWSVQDGGQAALVRHA